MVKMKILEEIKNYPEPEISAYMLIKAMVMMKDYNVSNLDDIGCFVVLDKSENDKFDAPEMEFVNVLILEKKSYLHGVKIIGDSYGEDVYMPVEIIDTMKC